MRKVHPALLFAWASLLFQPYPCAPGIQEAINIDPESRLSHLILYHQPTLSICSLHGFVACKLANEIYAIIFRSKAV
jgi:hypothetical protein